MVNLHRKFGLEFEHTSLYDCHHLARRLQDEGILIDRHATGHYRCPERCYSGWQVKTDASIMGTAEHRYGVELASPPLTLANLYKLRRVLKIAREFGKVNMSCGTHVRIEAQELFALLNNGHSDDVCDTIGKEWSKVEPLLFSYVPLSRRYNQYCQAGDQIFEHYNAFSLHDNGTQTAEFRLHQATLNPRKILAFAILCMAIIERMIKAVQQIAIQGHDYRPLPGIDPSVSQNVPPRRITLGRDAFYLQRVDKKWILEDGKRANEYANLLTAYNELRDKLHLGRDHLRAFHYPNHGNAMSLLYKDLDIPYHHGGYLEARYDTMVEQFGVFTADHTKGVALPVLPDEVDIDNEEELF